MPHNRGMATPFWFKLPIKLLHDPAWMQLSSRLQLLTIHVALLAAYNGGELPDPGDMAFTLRADREELETDLNALAEGGWVARKGGRWLASAFAEWQRPRPSTLRSQAHRARKKAAPGATMQRSRSVAETLESESESESEKEGKRGRAKRAPQPIPPAIDVIRSETNLFPKKSLWPDIAETVGEDPGHLDFWRDVVHQWTARGFNPKNIAGMLEWFRAGEIPPARPGRNDEPAGFQAIRASAARMAKDGH